MNEELRTIYHNLVVSMENEDWNSVSRAANRLGLHIMETTK